MDSPHEALRKRVEEELERRGRGSRTKLAKSMKLKNQSTITQWMDGTYVPGIDRLPGVAAFMDCSVADLFRVQESDGMTSRDLRPASNPPIGDAHGIDVGLLRSRIDSLEVENAALRTTIDTLADNYKRLAAIGVKARPAEKRKPALRKRRG